MFFFVELIAKIDNLVNYIFFIEMLKCQINKVLIFCISGFYIGCFFDIFFCYIFFIEYTAMIQHVKSRLIKMSTTPLVPEIIPTQKLLKRLL